MERNDLLTSTYIHQSGCREFIQRLCLSLLEFTRWTVAAVFHKHLCGGKCNSHTSSKSSGYWHCVRWSACQLCCDKQRQKNGTKYFCMSFRKVLLLLPCPYISFLTLSLSVCVCEVLSGCSQLMMTLTRGF